MRNRQTASLLRLKSPMSTNLPTARPSAFHPIADTRGACHDCSMNRYARPIRSLLAVGTALLTIAAVAASSSASATAVPHQLQGTWARHGRCDVPAERLVITSQRARFGKSPFRRVEYDASSQSISWDEEGVVSDFVVGRTPDVLVYETEGPNMPGEVGYARCGHGLRRVSWPPPR
jgi:hypothetical protein